MARKNQGALIECGKIGRPVGLKGDVAVSWFSGVSPVKSGDVIFAGSEIEVNLPCKILALQKQGRFYVMRLEGVCDREKAKSLTNKKLFVAKESLPRLPAGHYYSHEIIGLGVYTDEDIYLGDVVKIFSVGGHDVYEVRNKGGREILIPAVDHIVLKVDVKDKKITVKLLEGMLD